MKMQIFHKMKYDLKGNFYVMERFSDVFTFQPIDLITTLAYVLMETFVPVSLIGRTHIIITINSLSAT